MRKEYLQSWSETMRRRGVVLESGLSEEEVRSLEANFEFRLPPDLRAVLQFTFPVGKEFPNWRHGAGDDLNRRLSWPREGLCFDVEHNAL